ncbi:hypothetical protein OSG_eHP11_00065 [environmental Halophage eHP-11]|nr:hypothetical protein OSG_eHP11_00065 [environmental Halophage eHP-11]
MSNQIARKYTGQELSNRHNELSSKGEYGENHYQEAVQFVLERRGIECLPEVNIPDLSDSSKTRLRSMDLHLPDLDVAIELKLNANLRGVGQCMLYRQHHDKVLLLTYSDRPDVRKTLRDVDDVEYAVCVPGVTENPPVFDLRKSTGVGEILPEEVIIVEEEADDDA